MIAQRKTKRESRKTECETEVDCEELVQRFRDTNSQAVMGEIIERFTPMLRKMVRTSGGKRQAVIDLEDLRQAGRLGITKAVHSHTPNRGTFSNWCYLNVRWSIADELRKCGVSNYKWQQGVKREPLLEGSLLTTDPRSGLNFSEMIGVCRDVLTDQQMCVVVCHYGEGINLSTVARMIGVTTWRVSELHQSALDEMTRTLAFMRDQESGQLEEEPQTETQWRIIRFAAPSEFGLRYFAMDAVSRSGEVYKNADCGEADHNPHDLNLFVVAESGEDLREKLMCFLYANEGKTALQRKGIFC